MAALMTAAQVAARWQGSPATVNRYARTGALPAVRVGGSWRFAEHAVEAYERRQSTTAVAVEQPAPAAQEPVAVRNRREGVKTTITADDSVLPRDYSPVFPHLWNRR